MHMRVSETVIDHLIVFKQIMEAGYGQRKRQVGTRLYQIAQWLCKAIIEDCGSRVEIKLCRHSLGISRILLRLYKDVSNNIPPHGV